MRAYAFFCEEKEKEARCACTFQLRLRNNDAVLPAPTHMQHAAQCAAFRKPWLEELQAHCVQFFCLFMLRKTRIIKEGRKKILVEFDIGSLRWKRRATREGA